MVNYLRGFCRNSRQAVEKLQANAGRPPLDVQSGPWGQLVTNMTHSLMSVALQGWRCTSEFVPIHCPFWDLHGPFSQIKILYGISNWSIVGAKPVTGSGETRMLTLVMTNSRIDGGVATNQHGRSVAMSWWQILRDSPLRWKSTRCAGLHLQIDGGIPKDDLFVDDDHLLMMLHDG